MNILIVSSETETADSVKKILAARLSYKDVLAVGKGADGILSIKEKTYMDSAGVLFGKKAVKACDFKLLILDEGIPDIPVLVFVQAIRKLFDKTVLPIILMTQGENRDDLMGLLKAGANNFVLKPLNGENLKTKVVDLVGLGGGKVVTSAAGIFQKGPAKKKGASTLERMSSGGKSRGGGSAPIGAYYSSKKKSNKTDDGGEVPIVDDGSLIDGHFHEEVDIIGGGTNCVWGKEKAGSGDVVLEYVSPKGKATGIHVKTINKDDFLKNYRMCTPDSCEILKRLGSEKE